MEEFLILVGGFVLGWIAREWLALHRMNRIFNQMQIHEQEEEMENLIPIKIEYHDDKFYVYQQGCGTFMAQGTSRNELEENLTKRYPGKKFAANNSNLQEVGFK
jgi:hypothetical protein